MILKIKKETSAFTLIELMVVIVIIGILVAIAMPKYNEAVVRAKYVQLKANMKSTQIITETYAASWGGIYPGNRTQLVNEAFSKNFMKTFKNPFTRLTDSITDISAVVSKPTGGIVIFGGSQSATNAYVSSVYAGNLKSGTYVIYASDRLGAMFKPNNKIMFISNN